MNKKIVVLGGGIAGLSIARDLALRGFEITLIEKNTIGSGTTNKCAGMLHSGARYATKDKDVAKLCFQENMILRNIASFAVGKNDALFITLPKDSKEYQIEFEESCKEINIPVKFLSQKESLELEPFLNTNISGGYLAPDRVVDTYMLVNSYVLALNHLKTNILENTEILNATVNLSGWNLSLKKSNSKKEIYTDYVINATGDSLSDTAKLFNINIDLIYIHGTMAIIDKKVSNRIISRCAPSAIGDVIVPLDDLSLIGSTWHELPHNIPITMNEKDKLDILNTGSKILSISKKWSIIDSFTGIRTHIKKNTDSDDFNVKRDYAIVESNTIGVSNFISVLPGKLTIARFVAEKVGDIVSKYLNSHTPSITAVTPLPEPSLNQENKLKFYVN